MNKKNIIGYVLVVAVVLLVLAKSHFVDVTNYKDYQMSDKELSDASQ